MYLCVDVCSRHMHVYVQVAIAVYVCCMYAQVACMFSPRGTSVWSFQRMPLCVGLQHIRRQ